MVHICVEPSSAIHLHALPFLGISYLCRLSYCLSIICFISMQGKPCSSEIAELLKHENWISLNDTGYCFVNECTIRLKESNVLLSNINKTTDWITATNATDLFTLVLIPRVLGGIPGQSQYPDN